MSKLKAVISVILSLCIVSVPVFSSVPLSAGAEEEKSVEEKIEELDAKSAEYQAVLDKAEADISEKEAYGEALLSQISVMNEKIILTRQSVQNMQKAIDAKQKEIEKGNSDIDSQIDALCSRLSIIYMAGSASNLEILLGAKDFGDFIDKISLVKVLSEYDKKMIDELNGNLSAVEKQKKALENDKAKQEAEEAKLSENIKELNSLVQKNTAVLANLTAKSKAAKASLANTNSKTAQLEAEQAALIEQEQAAAKANTATAEQQQSAKRAAAEQQKNQAQQQSESSGGSYSGDTYSDDSDSGGGSSSGGSSSGGGSSPDADYSGSGYIWPCPGFYYLSSLWNEDRGSYNHGAIDIAGWGDIWGAPVIAAESGTVADTCTYCTHNYPKDFSESCGCGGGFGNYVWLDHGNGKETIYGHLTSVVVSPGQSVSKGQVVGYVGTTGHSTGPHLHFECRNNGVKYNPMTELSAYWSKVEY